MNNETWGIKTMCDLTYTEKKCIFANGTRKGPDNIIIS